MRWRKRPDDAEEIEVQFLRLCEQYQNLEAWSAASVATALPVAERPSAPFNRRDAEDLRSYVTAGTIEVVEASLSAVRAFLARFDPSYAEKLDPGEPESLTYLLDAKHETKICSADAIVFRVLGNLDRGEAGLSLEELLQGFGLERRLPRQFCRTFRIECTAKGVAEALQGRGAR